MAKKEKKENKEIKQKRHFFKDMKAELKKVIWPTAKQTANNTVAVIAFTLAIAVIVFVLDVVFDFANKKGVVALQEKIKTSYSASNTTESTEESETTEGETKTEEGETTTEVEAETKNEKKDDKKEDKSTKTESKKK